MAQRVVHLSLPGLHVAAAAEVGGVAPDQPVVVHRDGRVIDAAGVAVRPGQLLRSAQRIAPEADYIPAGELVGAEVYRAVWDQLLELGPVVEPTAKHAGYVDVTGCLPARGAKRHMAAMARRLESLIGQPPIWGVASSKLVAYHASAEGRMVDPDEAVGFLHRQPVRPMQGLPRPLVATLAELGCRRWGQVAEVPEARLYTLCGRTGVLLHRWSQAIDPRPVMPRYPPPSESVAVDVEPDEQGFWIERLRDLCRILAERLDKRQAASAEVVLALGRRGVWRSYRRTLSRPTHEARRLHEVALGLLPLELDPSGVDGLRLTLRRLAARSAVQLALFDDEVDSRARRLAAAVARLRQRYGLLAVGTVPEVLAPRERLAELVWRAEETL